MNCKNYYKIKFDEKFKKKGSSFKFCNEDLNKTDLLDSLCKVQWKFFLPNIERFYSSLNLKSISDFKWIRLKNV